MASRPPMAVQAISRVTDNMKINIWLAHSSPRSRSFNYHFCAQVGHVRRSADVQKSEGAVNFEKRELPVQNGTACGFPGLLRRRYRHRRLGLGIRVL